MEYLTLLNEENFSKENILKLISYYEEKDSLNLQEVIYLQNLKWIMDKMNEFNKELYAAFLEKINSKDLNLNLLYQKFPARNLAIPGAISCYTITGSAYSFKEGIQYSNYKGWGKGKTLYARKAIEVSDNHFRTLFKQHGNSAFNNGVFYMDRDAKEKLVNERIRFLISSTLGNRNMNFCFGQVNESMYKKLLSGEKDDRMKQIFTDWMTLQELSAKDSDLKRAVLKFKM